MVKMTTLRKISLLIFFMVSFMSFATYSNAQNHNTSKDDYRYIVNVKVGNKELGSFIIELFPDVAPQHVRNFDSLVSIGFYDGLAFHRVKKGFMIQGGCPNSRNLPKDKWGLGDSSQRKIPAEFSDIPHTPGIISAARTNDPNSATSQFFICTKKAPWLDGQYTVFGRVVEGMDVVYKIENVNVEKQPYGNEISSPVEKVEFTIKKYKD